MATDNADNTDDKGTTGSDDETVVSKKETSADPDAETVVVKKAASTEAAEKTEKVSTAETAPAAPAAPASSGGGAKGGITPLVAAFVAGILLVAAITAVVVFYLQADRRGAELAAVDDATRAACDFGRTVSEYDYANDLEGYFTRVEDNATGDFREEFDQAGQALSEAMVQAQVKSWVDDVQCGFQQGDTEQATVLVTMTQFRTNFTQPTPDRQFIVVIADLRNEDGKWKVAKLDSPMLKGAGAGLPGGTPAPAEGGTPTEGAPAEGEPTEEAPAPAPGN
ncbi:hypothetical protein [Nocardia shimofusensis]|uniref:hypothetical protein n=1 Tax=Nocardia shimofusensis TaxID=228596 RepID=UPI00082C164A|nr:hypothetical protein [Nocardia shimofusensis]